MGDDGETRKEKEGRRRKAMRGASRASKREGHREGGREVPGRHIVCLFVNLINANATATKRGQRRGREGRERRGETISK